MTQSKWIGLASAARQRQERALLNAHQAGTRIRQRTQHMARSPVALPQAFIAGFVFDRAVATTGTPAWKTLVSRLALAAKALWIGRRLLG